MFWGGRGEGRPEKTIAIMSLNRQEMECLGLFCLVLVSPVVSPAAMSSGHFLFFHVPVGPCMSTGDKQWDRSCAINSLFLSMEYSDFFYNIIPKLNYHKNNENYRKLETLRPGQNLSGFYSVLAFKSIDIFILEAKCEYPQL